MDYINGLKKIKIIIRKKVNEMMVRYVLAWSINGLNGFNNFNN